MPYILLGEITGTGGGGPITTASITDATATGISVLTGDAAAGRTALGAASTASVSAVSASVSALNWSSLPGKPNVFAAGADAAAARSAIGAGTSSLVLGTGAGDAKAGNWAPSAASISDATAPGRNMLTAATVTAQRTLLDVPTTAELAAKADASTVSTLTTTVSGKADSSELTAGLDGKLTTTVSGTRFRGIVSEPPGSLVEGDWWIETSA